MSSLAVDFCGVRMSNPLVAAASPATESVDGILKCANAGVGAVITKSIAQYDASAFTLGARRAYLGSRGLWATSTFRRETLTYEEGVRLIAGAVERTEVPVFASVAATEVEVECWLPTCLGVVEAGARLIQLDLFYLPQPVCEPHSLERIVDLLTLLGAKIPVPVVPKLNIEIPAYTAAHVFRQSRIAGFSLLDSVRVPSPIDVKQKDLPLYRFVQSPGMSSLFGSWQLPLTQHYTHILSRLSDLPICAGGGLSDARDALELIMLGATAVQFATAILVRGYDYIADVIGELGNLLDELGHVSIHGVKGLSSRAQCTDVEGATPLFENAKATIDCTKCVLCQRCLRLAFCGAIVEREGSAYVVPSLCDGCGFCTHFCEREAIRVELVAE